MPRWAVPAPTLPERSTIATRAIRTGSRAGPRPSYVGPLGPLKKRADVKGWRSVLSPAGVWRFFGCCLRGFVGFCRGFWSFCLRRAATKPLKSLDRGGDERIETYVEYVFGPR